MSISAAILAGGRATRYGGRDKGALLVDGRSIRDRQLAALTSITDDIVIVGGEGLGDLDGVRHVLDRVPGSGPLGGLHAALLETTGEVTIVVAGDMPYISAALLRHLAESTGDADVAVARTAVGYHPLCAAYTRTCLEPIARRLADRRLKVADLFEDVRVRVVAGDELAAFGDVDRLLANINSPADLRELETYQP